MKKKHKKLPFIIAGVVVVAGVGFFALRGKGTQAVNTQAVAVVPVTTGDVQEYVDTSGTVESRNKKTFFSPVNATVKNLNFQRGDTVKAGDMLITFDLENLEKDNKKAELNVLSGKYGYQDSINKSNKAANDKADAASQVNSLQAQVDQWKQRVADLNRAIAQVTKDAQDEAIQKQSEAVAQAEAQAKAQAEAAKAKIKAETDKLKEKIEKLTRKKAESTVKLNAAVQTLTQLQGQLSDAKFQQGILQQSYDEASGLGDAAKIETASQALKAQMAVVHDLEDVKVPAAQAKVNELSEKIAQEFDNPIAEYQAQIEKLSTPESSTGAGTQGGTGGADLSGTGANQTAADTTDLQMELQDAQSTLAELQSDLASKKAIAQADGTTLSAESKAQMEVNNNLQELESKTLEELITKGKQGITAEFSGVISDSKVAQGGMVTQGGEMFTLQSTQDVDVNISLSKYDFEKIQKGQKATVKIGAKEYKGTVNKISHIAIPNEKGTPVISASVSIDNPDEDIFLGVEAKVSIQAAEAKQVPVVPVEVVNTGNDGSFCYIVKDGVVAKQIVETGVSSDSYIEIKSGLEPGDQVIPDIGMYQEGSPVVPMDENSMNAGTGADGSEGGAAQAES
ncbi:efflux RND transporter periplasmic adaptor subunit [uncultured Robinsoniella sp.]|uniref:efflux RND transporter periplasmic adaptor subunit n=1 Tax=uncultured Robinsoniella sp. TaxID=904190 RepID=UPI00374F0C9C